MYTHGGYNFLDELQKGGRDIFTYRFWNEIEVKIKKGDLLNDSWNPCKTLRNLR